MKKTINGVEYETFAPYKNAEELGIDLSRKFIVVSDGHYKFKPGEILTIKKDDGSSCPLFSNGKIDMHCRWEWLAHYNEPKETNFIITEIKDPEQHKKVQQKLFDTGYEWIYVGKIIKHYNEDHIVVLLADGNRMSFAGCLNWTKAIGWYKYYCNVDLKPIPANEFLGESWKSTYGDKLITEIKNNPTTEHCIGKGNKTMSIITNAFKSKENKALEQFNLGTTEQLNDSGRANFIDFLFETMTTERKAFLAKIVDAYKEEKK